MNERKLHVVVAALLLIFSCTVGAASLRSGAATVSTLDLTNPRSLSASGTNRSGNPWIVTGYYKAGYRAAHDFFVTRLRVWVCGRQVQYNGNEAPNNWYTMYTTVTAIVPHGCSWRFSGYSNGYSRSFRAVYQEFRVD